jgi:lipid A 3-O-deacylase
MNHKSETSLYQFLFIRCTDLRIHSKHKRPANIRYRFLWFWGLTLMCMLFSGAAFGSDFNLDSPRNSGMVRLEVDNDMFFQDDSQFSNGVSLQYHTIGYDTWEESTAPGFIKWVGENFPGLGDDDTMVRYGQGIGQNIVTPADLEAEEPLEGDIPYAGTLTYTLNWQSFNREKASTFQITAGVLGEESGAGDVQEFVHDDMDKGEDPQGWDSQRDTEPVFNLGYQYLHSLFRLGQYDNGWAGQMTMGPSILLGNVLTGVDLGTAIRFGWNIQEGFSSYPAPPARGFFQAYYLPKPATASPHGIEVTLGARASWLGYSVIYDGSVITDDDRDVDREDYILSWGAGLNYHYYDFFSFRIFVLTNTDLIDKDSIPDPGPDREKTDADNAYGSLVFEFHF